ncbi:MAG: MMPL family transporter [bacterium]|nr:MMPL family transporter [bacterium]
MSEIDEETLESRLGAGLGAWVRASARSRGRVAALAALLFATSLVYTATELGIRSETEALFPEDLPFRVRDARFLETFPMLHENIVLVVEGPTAEGTRDATQRLAARLASQPELFPRVALPAHPFFERNGLLYLEVEELVTLADRLAQLQPLLAGLVADESLRGLMDQTRGAVEALHRERIEEFDLAPILARLEETVRTSFAPGGDARGRLDWSAIIDWGQSDGDPRRRVLQVQPALDYGSMAAARQAILRLRDLVHELGFATVDDPEPRDYRVRMTGDIVLNFDEMALLRTQVAGAGVGSFVVVAILLFVALRSGRLVLATVMSLLFGLVVTAGFATLAIGHLNMISVAFAVLFIGLGVDFGIHLCMRFQELREQGDDAEAALQASARGVGSSLMVCAATTSVGFFAFVPTDFIGVAELGVIAGVGMLIGVASSFTIIPAILAGAPKIAPGERRLPTLHLPTWPVRHAPAVVVGCALLFVAGGSLLPELYFDQNPLNVRDPAAESVQVYQDLLADSDRSPWPLEVLANTAEEADAIALRFEALPEVDRARTLSDFVPEEQAAKLEAIDEMAYFVDWGAIRRVETPPTTEDSIASLEALRDALAEARASGLAPETARAAASLESALTALLERLAAQGPEARTARIDALEDRLLGGLQGMLARLERAMNAERIRLEDVPQTVREERVSASGLHRVEIVPAEDLTVPGALDRFVAAGQSVTEDLAGPAIRIQASARAVTGALIQALASAVVVILVFLSVLWRHPGDVSLVMLPLLFAGVSTGASMVLLDIPFNFADVIVLPLLLGIGVDSGIHMVHRARIREDADASLLSTSTARAVVFSATTTIASFGTLALVPHRGMANLGQLLVVGVGWTVLANLVLLPALLELRERRARA